MWDEDAGGAARLRFALPPWRAATEPPELRGNGRDDVRLLVTKGAAGMASHLHFTQLPTVLGAGDVLVVNSSATLPAALTVSRADGRVLRVHVGGGIEGRPGARLVELRAAGKPWFLGREGESLPLSGGRGRLVLQEVFSAGRHGPRLWCAVVEGTDFREAMERDGEPIRYDYVEERWPLAAYQSHFSVDPGSSEMPSAGRPLTRAVCASLRRAGVEIVSVLLHTGLASPEAGERPYDEYFCVDARAVEAIGRARRVIAVGTTVVRALESASDHGRLRPARGWTDKMVTPDSPPEVVDALLTGFHEARSTHLQMLRAIAGDAHVTAAYRAALGGDYRWHEFGDVHLILP